MSRLAGIVANRFKLCDRFSVSRRKVLIGAGAGALVLGTVGSLSWNRFADHRARWVEKVVRSNLPGVTVDEPSLAVFVSNILDGGLLKSSARKASLFAEQALPWLTARIPRVRTGLETIERQVLTEYLLGSNFFRVADPKRETIAYYGPAAACANPFVWMK
jgi:hypothetical protein